MNTDINKTDLSELAKMSCEVVQGIDFPETTDFEQQRSSFLALLDQMDNRYNNNELLFNARTAVASQPVRKLEIYNMTRSIVRMARGSEGRSTDTRCGSTAVPSFPVLQESNSQPTGAFVS